MCSLCCLKESERFSSVCYLALLKACFSSECPGLRKLVVRELHWGLSGEGAREDTGERHLWLALCWPGRWSPLSHPQGGHSPTVRWNPLSQSWSGHSAGLAGGTQFHSPEAVTQSSLRVEPTLIAPRWSVTQPSPAQQVEPTPHCCSPEAAGASSTSLFLERRQCVGLEVESILSLQFLKKPVFAVLSPRGHSLEASSLLRASLCRLPVVQASRCLRSRCLLRFPT